MEEGDDTALMVQKLLTPLQTFLCRSISVFRDQQALHGVDFFLDFAFLLNEHYFSNRLLSC